MALEPKGSTLLISKQATGQFHPPPILTTYLPTIHLYVILLSPFRFCKLPLSMRFLRQDFGASTFFFFYFTEPATYSSIRIMVQKMNIIEWFMHLNARWKIVCLPNSNRCVLKNKRDVLVRMRENCLQDTEERHQSDLRCREALNNEVAGSID
jgi:hypothetical protein